MLRFVHRLLPSRADACWSLIIGALALGLRVAYAVQFTAHPLGRLLWVDEIVYWQRARAILGGKWLPDRPFFQDPLVQYLLAGVMPVVGTEVRDLRVALASLGALTPILTYWVGRWGLGRAEGVLGGVALAVYGPLVFADGQLEKEGFGAIAAALALLVTARAAEARRALPWATLAGCLWGAMALLRANALLVGPIGAAWWLARTDLSWRSRGPGALGFLAGFILALAPVSLINAAVSRPHEFILTTWQGGSMFYEGNGPEANGVGDAPSFVVRDPSIEADQFAAEAKRRAGRPLSPGEVSSFWMRQGLERWRRAPLASLRLLAFKLRLVLSDWEVPDSQSLEWVRLTAAPTLTWTFLSFGWLAPLAAIGLPHKDRRPFWWFLVATTVAGLVSTAVFFVIGRYRVPWSPGLALLAAAGVVDLARRLVARCWWQVVWRVALVGAPVAGLAWRPVADPDPNRWVYFQSGLFVAYLQHGDLHMAIDILDDVRAADPCSEAEAMVRGPGLIHKVLRAAVARQLAALSSGPGNALTHARLARIIPEAHALAGRLLDEVERVEPESSALWRERGGWWLGVPVDTAARRSAEVAYRRASNDPSARITLALLTSDPRLLDLPTGTYTERVRVARVLLANRRNRRTEGRPLDQRKVLVPNSQGTDD